VIWLLLASLAHGATDTLVLGDPDGLSVRPGLLLDVRGGRVVDGPPMPLVMLQRVRPALRGTLLGKKAGYVLQAEMAPTPSLLDAVVHVSPVEWLRVDAGRFLVPFSRSQLTPVPKLLFHGFSRSADAERYGRDVGLQLHSDPGPLEVRAGVFQGAALVEDGGPPIAIAHVGLDLVGHIPYDETQAGVDPDGASGWVIGASGATGPVRRVTDDAVWDAQTVGADTAVRLGPTRLQAELFFRAWEDGDREVGAYGQASVAPIPRTELAARVDHQSATQQVWTVQGLASWYQDGDHLRLSLQYEWLQLEDNVPTHTFSVQQQLWF
jgi:hypothetical protein